MSRKKRETLKIQVALLKCHHGLLIYSVAKKNTHSKPKILRKLHFTRALSIIHKQSQVCYFDDMILLFGHGSHEWIKFEYIFTMALRIWLVYGIVDAILRLAKIARIIFHGSKNDKEEFQFNC